MNFLRFGNIYLFLSALLLIGSVISIAIFGLQLGIDFTGGSILEVEYKENRPSNEGIQRALEGVDLGDISIQPIGEKGVIIRLGTISQETHEQVLGRLGEQAREMRFESIGPTIGTELKQKTIVMALLSLFAIAIYVALAFRRVAKPLTSWNLSVVGLGELVHDTLITLGVLAFLGKFYQVQIQIPIVVALLTIIGYSINDTVVVFDRIRENILRRVGVDFADTVNKSLQQTFSRSLNTSLATFCTVLAIFFLGGETLRYFAMTLAIGIAIGSYSSLFSGPAFLVRWLQKRG